MGHRFTEGDALIPHKMFIGSMIPEWLEREPTLKAQEKLCYARLARFAGKDGECFPSMRTIADAMGVGERSAKRYVHALKEKGLIGARQRGLGKSNSYTFLVSPMMDGAPMLDGGTLEVTEQSPQKGKDEHGGQVRADTTSVPGLAHIRESREEIPSKESEERESMEELTSLDLKSDWRTIILETLRRDHVSGISQFPNLHEIMVSENHSVPLSRRYDIRSELLRLLEVIEAPTDSMSRLDLEIAMTDVADSRQEMLERMGVGIGNLELERVKAG